MDTDEAGKVNEAILSRNHLGEIANNGRFSETGVSRHGILKALFNSLPCPYQSVRAL
jgi:hypothetical protein